MKTLLLLLSSFTFISAFSQNATASVQQTISFRLMDRMMVEKKAIANTSAVQSAVQMQSDSQWVVDAKEAAINEDMLAATEHNNRAQKHKEDVAAAVVYTVSKL